MKKLIYTVSLFPGILQAAAQEREMAELKRLNAKFIPNFVTNDTVSHSQIIPMDFVCITSEGQSIDRKQYLENWAHGFDGFKYWDYRNEDIKIFGNTALVHSQNKYIVVRDGKEITGMSMYTDTYIKENGQWKCVQAQLSKVAPEYFARDETIVRKYDYNQHKN
ncbi:MAG: nuclear transport factor 2 family protein [Chitinophagaceae bacterium]